MMLRPGNYVILDRLAKLGEEGAESGNPHHQVFVVLRPLLCSLQRLTVHYIELDMPAAHIIVCPHERHEFL